MDCRWQSSQALGRGWGLKDRHLTRQSPTNVGELSSKIVKDAAFKVYEGAPHGLTATHQDRFNADLLAFIRG
ncbi:alpha/beta hydrolase [Sphingomonas sanxanigenens]|uniref:Uncharacterized protein n=1 Tax=Sphingomonas sanxanigenens DSM 19645 = NX02 TaxID=1123269 RepID=W0AFQ2_9SPHN|nr:alpha/beta hydrolase [Sphingomonas sanxanigenens]AHE56739.1 hypothetical protein NX02_25670 [Sphingomonas sanxanigenens DSM 19645 = NX02]